MKPAEDNEGVMIDSIPVTAWGYRTDAFNRGWLEHTGLSLDRALG
jgi:hypothetical protein